MSMQAGELYVEIGARLEGLERGLARSEQMLQRTTRSMDAHSRRANKSLALIGSGLALYGVERAMMGMVNSAATLDKTLAQLRAVTGANAAQMDVFRKAALQAGTTTAYSVNQAAEAQVALAKAGMTTAQIIGGGFTSALNLATAGGMDLAQAAETMANGMNLFNLSAKQSSRIADGLAIAANTTTADVADFAMALTQGGTAAKAAGLNFNDTMLILESLAKIGVKNSDAGTSMKAAILALLTPTDKQRELMDQLGISFVKANGKFKDATQISQMLRDRLGGLTQTQRVNTLATIAGTDGVRALLALYNAGPATLKVWEQQLGQQGVAAKQAKTMQDNLGSSIDRFRNSVEAGGISLANVFAPQIRSAADGISQFIRDLQEGGQAQAFAEGVSDAIGGIGDAVTILSPAFDVIKTVMDELGGRTLAVLAAGFVATRVAVLGFNSAMGSLTSVAANGAMALNPVGAALMAIQIGVPIIMAVEAASRSAESAGYAWADSLDSVAQKLNSLQGLRMTEAQAGARVAVARATEKDLQQQINQLQREGKGNSKEALDLQSRLTRAVKERTDAEAAYKDAKGKTDTATTTAAKDYQKLLTDLETKQARLAKLQALPDDKNKVGRQMIIRDLEKQVTIAEAALRANQDMTRDTGWNELANKIERVRKNGLQPLSETANRAAYSILKMTDRKVAFKFATDDDAKINDKITLLGKLSQRADDIGGPTRKRAITILADSKNAEDAIARLKRMLGNLPNNFRMTFNGETTNPLEQAGGGRVRGGIPGKDSVLSLLMPGEVVLNATQQHLVDNGYSINDALRATGAAYGGGGTAGKGKNKNGGSAPKPTPKSGSGGGGSGAAPAPKASAPDVSDKEDKAQRDQWDRLTTQHTINDNKLQRLVSQHPKSVKYLDDRIAAMKKYQSKVNSFLGKKMRPALRSQVEGEKTSVLREIQNMNATRRDLSKGPDPTMLPASLDELLAAAELTDGTDDDMSALSRQEEWVQGQLKKKGLTNQQKAALQRLLKSIRDSKKGIQDRIASDAADAEKDAADKDNDAYEATYELPDDLEANLALAELTDGTEDDMAALVAEEKFYSGALDKAKAAGDMKKVGQMARALKSVRDQMKSLGGASASGAASGGLQGTVYEGYGSTAANLVGSMGSGGGGGGGSSSGGGASYAAASTGSGTIVNVTVNVQGQVLTSDGLAASLVEPIRTQLIAIGQRNGSIFGGYA